MDGIDRTISSLLDSFPVIHNNNTRYIYTYIVYMCILYIYITLHVLCIDGAFCTCLARVYGFLAVSDHIFLLTIFYLYMCIYIFIR